MPMIIEASPHDSKSDRIHQQYWDPKRVQSVFRFPDTAIARAYHKRDTVIDEMAP